MGSGLNAGNLGAEIDVIKPALLAQTHAPIRYSLRFRISRTSFLYRLAHFATSHFPLESIAETQPQLHRPSQYFTRGICVSAEMPLRCQARAAHPNAKLNANCSLEPQTMNYAKGHLFARTRVEFSFRALINRTISEQNREDRRLSEQRPTKHQFRARNSCIMDGRNYRFARRLLLFPRAQF